MTVKTSAKIGGDGNTAHRPPETPTMPGYNISCIT